MAPRLGAVSYLNTRPLTVALEGKGSPFQVSYAVPAVCAAQLRQGQIDVGLIPAIEYARGPEPYCIVPKVAIGCLGEVLTVRLYYKGELGDIKRVALDHSSRTSATLLHILLREGFGLEPELVNKAPDLAAMLDGADAALLIGDPVFSLLEEDCQSLDLGAAWFELTGLPFVFAFWAGRSGALDPIEARHLAEAPRLGLPLVDQIALQFSQTKGVPAALCARYLTQHIRYDLDDEALKGLRRFYALAYRHGQIEAVPSLDFYPIATAVQRKV